MADLVQRMRADLTSAMRSRDQVSVRVLRSTLSALANAEAQPDADNGPARLKISGGIAGATSGLGATDVSRRTLTDTEVRRVVASERDELLSGAGDLDAHGAAEPAAALRAQADVLDRYL